MSHTADALSELTSDLQELESILTSVVRSNVRKIIANEISSLKAKIDSIEEQEKQQNVTQSTSTDEKLAPRPSLYTTKITSYGWDESAKFVKLYVTLKDIDKLTQEQMTCEFTDGSFKFMAHNHGGKNHLLQIMKLAHNIKPKESSCKIKSGNVIISLKKEKESNTWGQLTEAERKQKELKDAKYDNKGMDASDPSAGIMNLMKNMYDEGDDDMKRMIKKTWYESQQKQGAGGGMGGMPGVGGGMGGMPDFSR